MSSFQFHFSSNVIVFYESVSLKWIQSGNVRNKAGLSPQTVGEGLLYALCIPTALVTMMVMDANHQYLLMVAKQTGASFGTRYRINMDKLTAQSPAITEIQAQSRAWSCTQYCHSLTVTSPTLSQLRAKHGL